MQIGVSASYLKMWTREATGILIQEYRNNDCMWMTNSPYYRNKEKRTEALKTIATTVSQFRPQTTTEDIKNKINGIRTQYVSEINKLIIARNKGEPHEPTLWCFEMLSFLKPFTQPKQRVLNENWARTVMPKISRRSFSLLLNTNDNLQIKHKISQHATEPKPQSSQSEDCIIIKEESDDGNEIEIIEEKDLFEIEDDYSSHSSYVHDQPTEDQSEPYKKLSASFSKPQTSQSSNLDSGCEDSSEDRVRKLFSPSSIGAEITLVPQKDLLKRKSVDAYEDNKKKKDDVDVIPVKKNDEADDRISIFGKFVMSQMKSIRNNVLMIKLEHTIQNAIIEAQLKQIELDEKNKQERESAN